MNRRRGFSRGGGLLLAGLWLLVASPVPAQPPPGDIALTIAEATGLPRTDDPVTSGVPIAPGDAGASWALFDGAQEIPLQTTVLTGRSTPWLLLDFQATLGAGQFKTYTLRRQPATVAAAQPVTVVEDAQHIVVSTGPLRTVVNKTDFNLFDEVWLDRDASGAFDTGEQVVSPAAGSNLTIHDAGTNSDCTGRGQPGQVSWEYQGPLRATLRVDGSYRIGATRVLDYTTRITWFAGRSWVRIDHVLRNSSATQERYVKLSSARVAIGPPSAPVRIPRSGAFVWMNALSSGASVELIPPTLVVSTAYNPDVRPVIKRQNTTVDVVANGGMVIGDLSHHGMTWAVDFAENLSAAEIARRREVAGDPMLALADESRYSDAGAFGQLRWSTYADEKDSYTRWGWTWPTPGNTWSYEHNRPRVQSLYHSWSTFDAKNEPEGDELWQNLVMLTRVQLPFYLDRARAWARYTKWEWVFRTDGFDYDGAWGNSWDGAGAVARPRIANPALTSHDNAYIANNIKRGKASVSHMWNGGLIDWYYLTGDRDALDAALDTAEQSAQYFDWQTPAANGVGGNARFPSRALMIIVRAWEATDDPRWKSSADHLVTLFTQSPFYDPRGFFYWRVRDGGTAYVNRFGAEAKEVVPFMMATAVEALYRYFVLTNDQTVRARLSQIGAFGKDHGLDPLTGYSGDIVVVDSPNAGNVLHLTYSQWLNEPPIIPYAAANSTESFINAMIVAYRFTGDGLYLQRAKYYWSQSSKREHVSPYGTRIATDTQVGRFANSMQGWDPMFPMFPSGGDWPMMSLLFYEAAREPPANIRDLHAE